MAAWWNGFTRRVLRDAARDLSSKELVVKYAVSRAWVDRMKQRRRETGEVAPRPRPSFVAAC